MLVLDNASAAIEFYKTVFGAVERMRMRGPNDSVLHAELEIGTGMIMLGDASPEVASKPPEAGGASPVVLHVYVEDVDETMDRAQEAGAKVMIPVADQFYGDRSGRFEDPWGHVWVISTHMEDVTPEVMKERMGAVLQGTA
jgi:PhnB protein